MIQREHGLAILASALCMLLCNCHREQKPISDPMLGRIGYPSGPWWHDNDINRSILGVSHILISHREAETSSIGLRVPERAQRSREEARKLAIQIATQARTSPDRFAELAKKYSDDPFTAPLGGVLGATFALQLPHSLVDGFGNIAPGAVSRVVESPLGYHVLKRLPVAPAETLDIREITIGYQGVVHAWRPDRDVSRTREQARTVAEQVAQKVRAEPAAFARIAEQYSDDIYSSYGGDYGEWSTYDPAGRPLLLQAVSGLTEGSVSGVVDTPQGFQIYRRMPVEPRKHYATSVILVSFRSVLDPDAPRDRDQARAIALGMLAELARDPTQFERLRREHCEFDMCNQPPFPFQEGYFLYPGLGRGFDSVPVGGIVPQVIDYQSGFAVARREDEARYPLPEPTAVLDLPRPKAPTLTDAPAEVLVTYTLKLKKSALQQLALDPDTAARFEETMDGLASAYYAMPMSERSRLTAAVSNDLAMILGPARAVQFGRIHQRLYTELVGTTEAEN